MSYPILKLNTKVTTTDLVTLDGDKGTYLESGAECVVIGDGADKEVEGDLVGTYFESDELRPVLVKYYVTEHYVLHIWVLRNALKERARHD